MVHGVDDIDAATNADAAASEECRQHVPGGFTQHGIRPINGGVYTIQQTSSKLPANVFKIHVLMMDVC